MTERPRDAPRGGVRIGIEASRTAASILDTSYLRALVDLVEREGGESLWIGEVPPTARREPADHGRPATHASAIEWLCAAAVCSTTLTLGTAILPLCDHDPVVLARRLATLDRLAQGRVIVGVGLGRAAARAAGHGTGRVGQGGRVTEVIEVMKTLWSAEGPASFDGRFFTFHGVDPAPRPWRTGGPPVLVGGHSAAAARRAGRLGLGLIPDSHEAAHLERMLAIARTEAVHGGWDPDAITLTVCCPDGADLAALAGAGATRLVIRGPSDGNLDETRRCLADALEAVR
jgi:alkanesulfonate monooxygenase SsuD/methylene tetrahydromethanopterin reductase-like flavin-dependent oxidoreductase (luciferase family)